jgi:regulator of replication initiation timing
VALLDRLAEFGKTLITINQEVSDFRETLRDLRADVKVLQVDHQSLRERLAKVESFQNATHAEMAADLAKFKAEVERAEIR